MSELNMKSLIKQFNAQKSTIENAFKAEDKEDENMATFNSNGDSFNSESFNNSIQPKEKIHYKGELRIVGQVVNQLTDKEPIGYVIMVEKTQKFKMYTVEQTKALLNRFKFVNAALENGKIINTECAMTRMPKFNTQMSVIGNHGVIILGEITDGTKKLGYRAMDTNAHIVDIEEHDIIKLSSGGVDIINAKIVTRDNKPIVSAIKSEFTKIEKSKLNEILPTVTKTQRHRYEQHIHKIMSASTVVLNQIFTKDNISKIHFSDKWAWREADNYDGRYYNPYKEYKIISKEIVNNSKYNCKITDKDKEILKKVGELPRQNKLSYTNNYLNDDTKLFMLASLQILLNNKDVYNRTIYLIRRNKYRLGFSTAKMIVDMGLACDAFKKLMLEAKTIYDEAQNRLNAIENKERIIRNSNEMHEFKTKTFTSGHDIAQLGFTISVDNAGIGYRTDYGYNKTLLYLGDIIGSGYDKYKSKSRCLGDLISIAYVEKLIHIINDGKQYGMSNEEILSAISIIITIAYMFNSTAMREYVEDANGMLLYEGVDLPNYDEIANIDYKLNSWLIMYYASGFNVFLSDDAEYEYMHSHLANAEIINYRQLGVKHDIIHPMLQAEFASVVSLITPESISGEDVTKLIGRLRFL